MMSGFDFEPAALCLIGSLLWAPLVLGAAVRLDRDLKPAAAERLWIAALGLAVAPTIAAPALSALGVSLRPAPVGATAETHAAIAPPMDAVAGGHIAAPAPIVSLDLATDAAGLVYFYGVVLALALFAARAVLFRLEMRAAVPVERPDLSRALESWRRRLGVAQPLRLKASEAASSVCVYGIFRPTIVFPMPLLARAPLDDLVMMGAHELAHVKRNDARLFAAAAAARILFWFNPFARRIAARLELAAEQAADARVLAAGAERRAYAVAFVEGLRFAAERARALPLAVPSFAPFDRKSRRERLEAILAGRGTTARRPKILVALASTAAALLAAAQAGLAANAARDGVASEQDPDVTIIAQKGEIVAPGDAVVIEATDVYRGEPQRGKVVVLKLDNGMMARFERLDRYTVKKGDRVKAGEKIGSAKSGAVVVALIDDRPPSAAPAAGAIAPAAPVARAPAASPATAAAPAPPASAEPSAPPAEELAGAPEEPDDADFAFDFDDEDDLAIATPRARLVFRLEGDDKGLAIVGEDGSYAYSIGARLSPEDKKRLKAQMKTMRRDIERATKEAAAASAELGEHFRAFKFDRKRIEALRDEALVEAQRLADLWRAESHRAWREAARARDAAEEGADRAEAGAEAKAELMALEEEIRDRAEALAEAEKDLAEERAELERLSRELKSRRGASSD